ncbi:limulus clotting factor C-like isoform X2 [Galleria mellonella]|uniref:Limulus clotting factor C-like isoform X2 n=1 Tax=Galleria mellonella TaxID=7137 RepID=A0ABM3MDL3_GALME|nr:limulus clotting factor C-like isoform X2 [Galleria mellonella]
MNMLLLHIVVLSNILKYGQTQIALNAPIVREYPCKASQKFDAVFEVGLPKDQNKYYLNIYEEFPAQSRIGIKFDSEAIITTLFEKPYLGQLSNRIGDTAARIGTFASDYEVFITISNPMSEMSILVRGPDIGTVPYPMSIIINSVEYCENPNPGFVDRFIEGYKGSAIAALSVPSSSCGRRKVQHTELIVNGRPTKPGDWPWHGAIYRLEKSNVKYICGGTLISKSFVITAAHCSTINGGPVLPEIMSVIFGKYNLIGGDIAIQEREIYQNIVHEDYNPKRLDNDIALLKMKTEVKFDDYVQPACLWHLNAYKKVPKGTIKGTSIIMFYFQVVGWGFNHNDTLATTLHQVVLPKILDSVCVKSNIDFFGKILNDRKFCAGYRNGTSACNGDSGGAYQVFVPDTPGDTSVNASGSWHVHGIVSLALSRPNEAICDNTQYSIFTDINSFAGWIYKHFKPDY